MVRQDNFSKYQDLRKEFPCLSYESYYYYFTGNSFEISYYFSLSGKYSFNPRISIPYKENIFQPVDTLSSDAMDNLVFQAGMIELISYWKAACPPEIIVKPHHLSDLQVQFWKKIYFHGLGEFFYMNSIPAEEDDFTRVISALNNETTPFRVNSKEGSIVPVGGGKDSAVTMGILNRDPEDWLPFVINPGNTAGKIIRAAGRTSDETVELYREIHPQLLKLNKEGFLNGHTPFSALLAFYSLLAAYLTGRTDIILSNESSANEVTVPGTTVNHQYSKSFEFEKDFRQYVRSFISEGFNYFSLLRPLPEIQIARLFSGMPEFLPHFKSCNVGSKTDTWCGSCPKCLFTFIILSPFLKPGILSDVFGKNLLDDPALEGIFNQLTGKNEIKPFECIGTVDEVKIALELALDMYDEGEWPYLLNLYRQASQGSTLGQSTGLPGANLGHDHFVPGQYLTKLAKALR
ncbi:MAG: hypothetical protein MUC31_07425 [Bacteroidales bacterium]|jgi:hypothetical protein|nr:hypothetical protein [Bacteroidales bacterium]